MYEMATGIAACWIIACSGTVGSSLPPERPLIEKTSLPSLVAAEPRDYSDTLVKITPLESLFVGAHGLGTVSSLELGAAATSFKKADFNVYCKPEARYIHDGRGLQRIETTSEVVGGLLRMLVADPHLHSEKPPAYPAVSVMVLRRVGTKDLFAEVFIDLANITRFADGMALAAVKSDAFPSLVQWAMNI
ncbi:MAG: hypothetical protein GY854_24535 [Deltaproteobacteria bacterium]|nr:hypothetical protein [Deltaproteobacteria bacterium]